MRERERREMERERGINKNDDLLNILMLLCKWNFLPNKFNARRISRNEIICCLHNLFFYKHNDLCFLLKKPEIFF